MNMIGQWDVIILQWIQENIRQPWLTPIMKAITVLGNGWIWAVILGLMIYFKRTRRAGILCLVSLVLTLTVTFLIKQSVGRIRPFISHDTIDNLINVQDMKSFPSGHTSSAFAVAFMAMIAAPRFVSIPIFILACLIAFSRLYLGVHYPTDIIGGLIVAALSTAIIWFFRDRILGIFGYSRKESDKP